jgi:sulfur carrier protein ThiS adenylyltransferase
MNWEEIKKKLGRFSAGIAGAGGLGSNCAMALTRVGIGRLVICDFDRVEESNLNRQFYFHDQIGRFKTEALRDNLLKINPFIDIEIQTIRLEPENIPLIFDSVDLLIEAFDRADQKVMLIESALSNWPGRPVIAGSGMAGIGGSERIHLRRSQNLYICGDEESETGPDHPTLAPKVGMVAGMMADIAVELLLSK